MFLLLVGGAIAFIAAYFVYGSHLERLFGIGSDPTPAHLLADGRDFHPARPMVLFGHHFSSIAGAGPIVGPIIATLVFGWAPTAAWIIVGSIFVGGVHDFGSLALSIKHKGASIAQIAHEQLSRRASKLLLAFTWLAIVYVLAVFLDLTAVTFAPRLPAGIAPELAAAATKRGGSVATASILFILLALVLGTLLRRRATLAGASVLFVPLVFVAIFVGVKLPLPTSLLPALAGSPTTTWSILLVAYCFIASVSPVWLLLQPRDYLSSFLLYACLLGALVGIAVAGLTGAEGTAIAYPAFVGFHSEKLGYLFPALFITVACGACSGFHSIVASGTTARQLDRQQHARPVGYGSMLVEGLLALVAVATVAVLSPGATETALAPPAIFASGLARFMATFGLSPEIAQTFALLALSTFLLTTLDTATRLGRYLLEELLELRGRFTQLLSTTATLALPCVLSLVTFTGKGGAVIPVWKLIWPVFGSTNQLLGGLALLVITVWLRRSGRPFWVTLVPAVAMLSATILALVQLVAAKKLSLVGIIAAGLLALAVVLLIETVRVLRERPTADSRS